MTSDTVPPPLPARPFVITILECDLCQKEIRVFGHSEHFASEEIEHAISDRCNGSLRPIGWDNLTSEEIVQFLESKRRD